MSCALNAAFMALLNAGIPMSCMAGAVSCFVLQDGTICCGTTATSSKVFCPTLHLIFLLKPAVGFTINDLGDLSCVLFAYNLLNRDTAFFAAFFKHFLLQYVISSYSHQALRYSCNFCEREFPRHK